MILRGIYAASKKKKTQLTTVVVAASLGEIENNPVSPASPKEATTERSLGNWDVRSVTNFSVYHHFVNIHLYFVQFENL